ncbi:hypothetical protein [Candidatus Palauibacter sp.]|uniref:hypothetical protein n=1 Tax=Candidatus Palauibacter sp. TaxID=3101350 RepID=UPI003B59C4B3
MVHRHVLAILLSSSALGGLAPAAAAQEMPVDRWLVTGAEVETGVNPLSEDAARFPGRNLETESGVWTLVRRDGEVRFDFSDLVEPDRATLAHAYLKSLSDADVRLELEVEACVRMEAWLNGQLVVGAGRPREVRLAGGWNTLLVVLEGESGCERSVSATLSANTGPNVRDDRSGQRPLVQASRPPGVRPNYPEGVVTVSVPQVTALAWNPGQDDLTASVSYELASWGLDPGQRGGVNAPGVQRPAARPPSPLDAPRRGGGRGDRVGTGAGGDDDTGPTDPDGMRAAMVAQLLGRPEIRAPAPTTGSVELRLAGESFVGAANDLRPGVPVSFDGTLPFRKLREAALREDGIKAEFRWGRDDGEGEGRMPAAPVLLALHAPLQLGLADGAWRGELRVPDALAGFTVRGLEGSWTVDGTVVEGGLLCGPCERGRRLEVEFRGPGGEAPRARIVDRGFPDLADAATVSPLDLLRALEGDNRRYRALVGG